MRVTLMICLRPGCSNSALLHFTADLADRLDAEVVGIAGCQPIVIATSEDWAIGDVVGQDRLQMQREIEAARDEFMTMPGLRSHAPQWRSHITPANLSTYVAREARCADLLIVGAMQDPPHARPARDVDGGTLVLEAGRPVLLVPSASATLPLAQVLVAWKDTREARRAVLDALPLLRLARRVAVVEIAPAIDEDAARHRVADVSHWLHRHGIESAASVSRSYGEDANELASVAQEMGADLLVAGAYGHGRLREWVLGGMSRDMLLHVERCTLLSH